MHRFAGLPQPLRWVAGQDALAHDRALAQWVAGQAGMSTMRFTLPLEAEALAADGFHPGAPVYRLWGDALAGHIIEQVLPAL
jgi:lysophospholipase L1-like esterase